MARSKPASEEIAAPLDLVDDEPTDDPTPVKGRSDFGVKVLRQYAADPKDRVKFVAALRLLRRSGTLVDTVARVAYAIGPKGGIKSTDLKPREDEDTGEDAGAVVSADVSAE